MGNNLRTRNFLGGVLLGLGIIVFTYGSFLGTRYRSNYLTITFLISYLFILTSFLALIQNRNVKGFLTLYGVLSIAFVIGWSIVNGFANPLVLLLLPFFSLLSLSWSPTEFFEITKPLIPLLFLIGTFSVIFLIVNYLPRIFKRG